MTEDKPNPRHRGNVEAYVEGHSYELPPVKAPEAGQPIADHRVWPGDVLAKKRAVLLVVDITDDEAICYDVGEHRYMTYYEKYINKDLEESLYRHGEVVEPPQTPVR